MFSSVLSIITNDYSKFEPTDYDDDEKRGDFCCHRHNQHHCDNACGDDDDDDDIIIRRGGRSATRDVFQNIFCRLVEN